MTHNLMEYSAVPTNLSIPKVATKDVATSFAPIKTAPRPSGVQLFRMKKGLYSQKC